MKTTSGTFGIETQASNSLVSAMLKYPEIGSTLIQQYPRFALTYLLERTGRFANVKVMGDKSFEWKVLGRSNREIKCADFTTISAASTDTAITKILPVLNRDLSINDVVMINNVVGTVIGHTLANGTTVKADTPKPPAGQKLTSQVLGHTLATADAWGYQIRFSNGYAANEIASSSIIARLGSAFGEGSLGTSVSESVAYPETHKNWLTLNRRKQSITGSALTDVTWIENNGSKLWYFTAEKLFTDEFMYQLELQRWFGRNNVTTATDAYTFPGHAGTVDSDASALMGDGILAQIEGSISMSYNVGNQAGEGLTEDKLARFIAELSRNAKAPEGNEWVVFTGTEGRYQFHRAMKDISVGASVVSGAAGAASGGSMQSMKTGSDVSLGVNFVSYYVLGNKLTIAYCPVFDDVNAFGAEAEAGGNGSGGTMSGKMVFLDFSSVDGVPNIQLIAKGSDGLNRNYVKKYIPGMVNPYDQNSMLAANGDDSFTCQIMSESGVIVRNPLSCGILSATH